MSTEPDAVTRRNVLKTSGTALAALGGAGVAADSALALPPLTVRTDPATNVDPYTGTLNGYLEYLGDNNWATVRFRWGVDGQGMPNTTSWQLRSSTGAYSETLTDLAYCCETYEFQAEARAGDFNEDHDLGDDVLEFTTGP